MKIVSSGFGFKRSESVAEVSVHVEDHIDSPVTSLAASSTPYCTSVLTKLLFVRLCHLKFGPNSVL